jgi:hypothetical protein
MGHNVVMRRQDFTTENTENHGDARRFFGFQLSASPQVVEPPGHWGDAQSVAGPISPCNSVVLGVLRGKNLAMPMRRNNFPLSRAASTLTANHIRYGRCHQLDDIDRVRLAPRALCAYVDYLASRTIDKNLEKHDRILIHPLRQDKFPNHPHGDVSRTFRLIMVPPDMRSVRSSSQEK